MPPRTRKQNQQSDQGTHADPVEINNSKTEAAPKPDEENTAHQTQLDTSRSFKPRHASSTTSHWDELIASEEETRAAAEALESLQRTDDPDRSPSREDEYFQGSRLRDNIIQALSWRKSQPHSVIQQPVVDALTRALVSLLYRPPRCLLVTC